MRISDRAAHAGTGSASRRTLLRSGLSLAALGAATCRKTAHARPMGGDPEGKFDAQGHVLPWAGDTIICPLDQQAPAAHALRAIHAEILQDWQGYVTATPPSSYHMTIYGGADPQCRAAGWWPHGVPMDAPMGQVDAIILERLRRHVFTMPQPIRMRVQPDAIPDVGTVIPLCATTVTEAGMLFALRREIAQAIGLQTPNIMTFQFHMTFGYPYRPMPTDIAVCYARKVREWRTSMARHARTIAFGTPQYCRFDNMFAFHPVFSLRTG